MTTAVVVVAITALALSFWKKRSESGSNSVELSENPVYDEYIKKIPSLENKVVAITGTTSGMGFCLAQIVIEKGAATVLCLNRESSRAKESDEKLRQFANSQTSKTKVEFIACNLQVLNSVRTAADVVKKICEEKYDGGLDILICNAGVMAMNDERTVDGYDIQMQTNQLSHFLLISLLFEKLKVASESKEDGEARVVMHSSSARYFPKGKLDSSYFMKCEAGTLGGDNTNTILMFFGFPSPWQRYHQSKLANAAFTLEFANRLASKGSKIKSLVADPGYASTSLNSNSSCISSGMSKYLESKGQSAKDGCMPIAIAAFGEDAKSGDMYIPLNVSKGVPVKSIEAGVPVKAGTEKDACNKENMELVWNACEQGLSMTFTV